jgi:transposase
MTASTHELFLMALGLSAPWAVHRAELTATPSFGQARAGAKVLEVELTYAKGAKFPCPTCGKLCPVHDAPVRTWRHLDFWQHTTYLRGPAPRVWCEEHQTGQAPLPWARYGSGFTLAFEMMVIALVADMSVLALAKHLGEQDTRLWRVVRHYVEKAHAETSWAGMQTVAIDETSTSKGHKYCTTFVDLDSPVAKAAKRARLILMLEGKEGRNVGTFVEHMPLHGATPSQIVSAAIDMGRAYIAGVETYLPNANIVFDRYHVMALCGKAIDELRREMRRLGLPLKGALWALRGNKENLKPRQLKRREELCREHRTLARALALRESLQELWDISDEEARQAGKSVKDLASAHLDAWCAWAQRSRLASFVKLARTLREHREGILGYYISRTTSAAIEAINGVIQHARRRARGFRNFANFRAIAYLMAGLLDLKPRSA